jgi:hypothetical protein
MPGRNGGGGRLAPTPSQLTRSPDRGDSGAAVVAATRGATEPPRGLYGIAFEI